MINNMKFRIATGTDLGKVENKEVSWETICKKLTKHKIAKRKGGKYLVGGAFSGHNRLEEEMICRSLLTIDIDTFEGSIDDLEFELDLVLNCAYVAYSTYQHTSDKPRIRVIIPLDREVTVTEYRSLSRAFVNEMGINVDNCSFTPNTAMYMPSMPEDGEAWSMIGEGDCVVSDDYINVKLVESSGGDEEFFDRKEPLDIDIDDVKRILKSYKNEDLNYDDFKLVGMALWHQFQGSDEGYDAWVNWSKQSDKHDERLMPTKWNSFDPGERSGEGVVTMATLIKAIGGKKGLAGVETEELVEKEIKIVNEIVEEMKTCDQVKLQVGVVDKIRDLGDDISSVGREMLCVAFRKRMQTVSGVNIPIKEVREMLSPTPTGESGESGEWTEEDVAWCKGWVYVNTFRGFVDIEGGGIYCSEAFNVLNGKEVVAGENGGKLSATKFVGDNGLVRVVNTAMYLPMFKEKVCRVDGQDVYNTFDARSVPTCVREDKLGWESGDGKRGWETVEKLKRHFRLLCGGEVEASWLFNWLCHLVQYPGKLIGWAMLIQSIEGVGKSMIKEMMGGILGVRNVGVVSPTLVMSPYNDFAEGVLLNIMEELKITGHNRHDAANALKTLITDPTIPMNVKYQSARLVINTCNYLVFTNFKDAIPVGERDRRFCIIHSPIEELTDEHFAQHGITEGVDAYYDDLRTSINVDLMWIRKAMLEHEIPTEFMNLKRAPMTESKKMVIATESANYPFDDEVRDAIEKGGKLYNKEVISSSDLFSDMAFENEEICGLASREKNAILKRLGYMQLSKQIKVNGKMKRMWAKKFISNDKVRKSLSLE